MPSPSLLPPSFLSHLFPAARKRECFWVKHYAGKVKYTVHGWVEKNMDRIPQSFVDTLRSSNLQVSSSLQLRQFGGILRRVG